MTTINQTGIGNQLSTGDESPIIKGEKNKVKISCKQKYTWFVSGIVLPVIAGLIIEIIKEGNVSNLLNKILSLF